MRIYTVFYNGPDGNERSEEFYSRYSALKFMKGRIGAKLTLIKSPLFSWYIAKTNMEAQQ